MISGDADTKARLEANGVATGKLSDALLEPPTMLACNLSSDCTAPQPLSLYCKATLALVAVKVKGDKLALPWLTQEDVTLTLTGEPTEAPVMPSVSVVWP